LSWPGLTLPRAQIYGTIEKVVSFQDIGVRARLQGRKINPLITLLLCPRGQNILEMCARGRDTPGHDGEAGHDGETGHDRENSTQAGVCPDAHGAGPAIYAARLRTDLNRGRCAGSTSITMRMPQCADANAG